MKPIQQEALNRYPSGEGKPEYNLHNRRAFMAGANFALEAKLEDKNVLIFVAKELGEYKVRQGYSYSEVCDLILKYAYTGDRDCSEQSKRISELEKALELVVQSYETDGMEGMNGRDKANYNLAKQLLNKHP
jgi:hypothetical protein